MNNEAESETEKSLNIYQRINEVRKAVSYVQKDKKIQGYKGVTHDQVTAHIRDACVEHGIITVPKQINSKVVDTGMKTSSGTPIIRYEAKYKVFFVNIDDPNDRIKTIIESHANDTGDKAPGKSLSYAVKSVELKIFMLETGENDESRVEGARRDKEKITAEQVNWVNEKIIEYKVDELGFNNFLKKNRCKRVEDITANFFPTIETMINKKGEEHA